MGSSGLTNVTRDPEIAFSKIRGIPDAPKKKITKGSQSTSTSLEIKWEISTPQEAGWESAVSYKIYTSTDDSTYTVVHQAISPDFSGFKY